MPGAISIAGASSVAGLTLRAFVLFDAVTGVIRKASGVSAVNRTAAGTYTITISPAMPDAFAFVDVRVNGQNSSQSLPNMNPSVSVAAGTVNVTTHVSTTPTDYLTVWVGIFG